MAETVYVNKSLVVLTTNTLQTANLVVGTGFLTSNSVSGSLIANTYTSGGSFIRQLIVPIYTESATQPSVASGGDEWFATSNSNLYQYSSGVWNLLKGFPSPTLYTFTTATFTTGGATGRYGPSLSQARSGLTGTPTPSNWYNSYLNMTTQGIQLWTVPGTANYRIKAYGATGKNYNNNVGEGAIIQGVFSLTQGQILFIAIGHQSEYLGTYDWQGGSGGTFVAAGSSLATSYPLIVAGGGGTNRSQTGYNVCMRASTSTSGVNGSGGNAGGTNGGAAAGGGHNIDSSNGGGAAGYYGNGNPKGDLRYGGPYTGSQSFTNGCVGGDFIGGDGNHFDGGFGCGGPGGWGGSGGGGGYSGGGNDPNGGWSGGGGSFIANSATSAATSDGSFGRTGSEPTTGYSGAVTNLSAWWSGGAGKVEITVV